MDSSASALLETRSVPFVGSFRALATGGVPPRAPGADGVPVIGVLEGSGVGPEVIGAALRVLAAVEEAGELRCDVRRGGLIGEEAQKQCGRPLPEDTAEFCAGVFAAGGAILNGPGGGRYVYDLRQRFDLYCKFVPVRPWPQLARAGRLNAPELSGLDLLIVRDNTGGIYQGRSAERDSAEGRVVEHTFWYSEAHVRRLMEVAARAAAGRRGVLHVILKDGGLPGLSDLWREVGAAVAQGLGVKALPMNVDLAAYELIQRPAQFDVIIAPNMIGDIIADIAGVLVASRGVTFSGNYSGDGKAVYQTNHGCAHDLAGRDAANPGGQILSLAMLLRESFAQHAAADLMERALAAAWEQGWRTADIAEPGCRVVGTRAMAEQVARQVRRLATTEQPDETRAVAG
jgi:3-isopropylmalate dehydrogenase